MKNRHRCSLFAIGAGILFPLMVHAASVIDWGAGAKNTASDSDVSTAGTLVAAFNIGAAGVSGTNLNGVLFSPFAFPNDGVTKSVTLGNFQFTETSAPSFFTLAASNSLGSANTPFSLLTSSYQSLLSSAGGATDNNTLVLTMSGLIVGQAYLFEFWTNNARNTTPNEFGSMQINLVVATAGNGVTLDSNTTNTAGGLGQYAIGTFTADNSTFSISFDGDGTFRVPLINAFEIRAIPEPSVCGLLTASVLALTSRRRRGTRRSNP